MANQSANVASSQPFVVYRDCDLISTLGQLRVKTRGSGVRFFSCTRFSSAAGKWMALPCRSFRLAALMGKSNPVECVALTRKER